MPRAEEANSQTSTTASSPTERSPSSQSPQPCERSSQSSTQGSRQSSTNRVDDEGWDGHPRLPKHPAPSLPASMPGDLGRFLGSLVQEGVLDEPASLALSALHPILRCPRDHPGQSPFPRVIPGLVP